MADQSQPRAVKEIALSSELPLIRRKLSDEIEARLISHLQSSNLAPGDPLPSERELMETFKIGRPTIREAMQNLQRMGLIEIRHGERPRVATPSLDKVFSQLSESMHHILAHSEGSLGYLLQVREIIERQMARIAAQNCDPDNIARLQAILDKQEQALDSPVEFMHFDGEFHFEIARASKNPICLALSQAIFGWLKAFHIRWISRDGKGASRDGLGSLTLSEHRLILRAIEEGDPEAAELTMRTHLSRANSQYSTLMSA